MTTLRLEFGEAKSASYRWVVRLCKAFPSYRCDYADGLTIHSVLFHKADLKSFEAIWCKVGAWNNTALYLDGKLISAGDLSESLRRENRDFVYQPMNNDLDKPLHEKRAHADVLAFLRRNSNLSNPN